ncbi:MAG: hypothetical protein M4579_000847 [Chaenotheca gracillima]|nr:MAG: hypothetical protein M4579_000847 [Chaenotheca gracillima]
MLTSTRPQAATYLLCVCLFSISFLVFLNSSVSFVITELIGVKDGVGNLVGTLGFADEIVALVACPLWGVLSDRVGVRTVCVLGYGIVGIALFIFVQASNVYPQLLLARLFFSIGGAATSTMVTAILPAMTAPNTPATSPPSAPPPDLANVAGTTHSTSPSLSSEVTITPARFTRPAEAKPNTPPLQSERQRPARLAGIVGMFTGCGALVALLIFLRLPALFGDRPGVSSAQAVADSYYVVGSVALVIAICCFFGLRNLKGEEGKGLKALVGKQSLYSASNAEGNNRKSPTTLVRALADAVTLGFRDADIGLGYLAGFVARASSVGITLFIPLFVNAYFISSGLCDNDPSSGNFAMKEQCRRAYILASKLTGVSQLVALLAAPIFGYLSDRYRRFNIPLLSSSLLGIIAYIALGLTKTPETSAAEGGSPVIYLLVALIGINQIGAIVCSLGLIGTGVLRQDEVDEPTSAPASRDGIEGEPTTHRSHVRTPPDDEHASLLPHNTSTRQSSSARPRSSLKGSVAGVYSLAGGAGILLLTKLGGYLFDSLAPGAPFFILAIFNAVMLVVGTGVGFVGAVRRRGRESAGLAR